MDIVFGQRWKLTIYGQFVTGLRRNDLMLEHQDALYQRSDSGSLY